MNIMPISVPVDVEFYYMDELTGELCESPDELYSGIYAEFWSINGISITHTPGIAIWKVRGEYFGSFSDAVRHVESLL